MVIDSIACLQKLHLHFLGAAAVHQPFAVDLASERMPECFICRYSAYASLGLVWGIQAAAFLTFASCCVPRCSAYTALTLYIDIVSPEAASALL